MKLSKENLAHINSIAHDGKVLLFGTDNDGVVWYTVKQSGFEDSVFGTNPSTTNGFEVWKKLPLGESTYDASAAAKFSTLFVPVFGKDQSGNENPQAVKSAVAPVQLVSGIGHLHVFRQSTDNKLLVNRFILDGMLNELTPKLDVRFKRSRQKYEVSETMKTENDAKGYVTLSNLDALDFKDMDGNPFYEPTWKLDFIENLHEGWFSAILLPSLENEKYRWSLFAYDSVADKVILYTIRASHSGIFDLKDYPFLQPDPKDNQKNVMRTIPGIIKRTLDIKTGNKALIPSNGLAATVYDLQEERIGDDGESQLLKDATRVMLAVPVKEEGTNEDAKENAAVLSFSVGSDGTLSQVDEMPETQQLFAEVNELILPLNTLDEIKEFIDTTPPPSGVMTGVKKSSDGMVTVLSKNLPDTFTSGQHVKISSTKNYNGLYKVIQVIEEQDGTKSLEIEAEFTNDEAGFWEVVPKTQNALTFDNMVVGHQKAGDDLLKVVCSNHNLEIGDEVQVTGTRKYDGLYPVKAVDELNNSFTIDMDYQPGEAVDLKAKQRRGIRFGGGGDYLRTGNAKLDPFVVDENGGRTVSAWVWLERTKDQAQLIVGQDDHGIELEIDADNKLQLRAQLNDKTVHTVKDPDVFPLKTWVHCAGAVEYLTGMSKETHLYLCKNGVKVTPSAAVGETINENEKVIDDRYPTAQSTDAFRFVGTTPEAITSSGMSFSEDFNQDVIFFSLLRFDGVGDYIDLGENVTLGSRFTQECWVYPSMDDNYYHLLMGNYESVDKRSPSVFIVEQTRVHFGFSCEDLWWINFTSNHVLTKNAWNHIAVTYDETYYKLYVNGGETFSQNVSSSYSVVNNRTSRNKPILYLSSATTGFEGYLQEVRLWNRALSATEINDHKNHRFSTQQNGLKGYYQFDRKSGSNLPDQSGNDYDGTVYGSALIQTMGSTLTLQQRARFFTGQVAITLPKKTAVTIQTTAPAAVLTLAFWIKTYQSSDVDLVNYTTQYTRSGDSFAISTREFSVTNPGDLHIYVGDSGVDTNVAVNDGEWHYLAISWESENGVLELYKDGEKAFTLSEFQKGYQLSQAATAAFVLGVNGTDHFDGNLGQVSVWSKVLSTAQIKQIMKNSLTGEESDLVAAWVHGGSKAYDISPQQNHGSLHDAPSAESIDKIAKSRPIRLLVGGTGEDVGSFTGKISELRVWNIAQNEKTIQNRMHMPLNGREDQLVGNWRMGAIVTEKSVRLVPDFSKHSNNALVYGTPFVSERSLNRKSFSDNKIVRYANDELVAVSQRARYRESFEFKIQGGDGNAWTSEQLNNADGRNNNIKVFQFAFWGKAGRSSEKTISFPADLYIQEEFSAVADAAGWFRASCEFTVPEGVSMVRTFDIVDIRGLWGSETVPPTSEWTTMEVRRHQIEHISNAITRKSYADEIVLEATGDGTSGTIYELWEEIYGQELCEADLSRHLQNLVLRIDIVRFRTKYENEKATKEEESADLTTQLDAMTERDQWLGDEINRLSKTIEKKSSAFQEEIERLKKKWDEWQAKETRYRNDRDEFRDQASKWYNLIFKHKWQDLERLAESKRVEAHSMANRFKEEWQEERQEKDRVISALSTDKQTYESEKNGIALNKTVLESQRDTLDKRISLLGHFLGRPVENQTDLAEWQTTTQEGLEHVRATLNAKNTEFLRNLAQNQQQPQGMELVDVDSNKLVTRGALLSFVSPKSRLHAMVSARGNVELNYFDTLDKLQCTVYDATADSRNTTFEQWLTASLHPAVEFRETDDKMYFENKTVSFPNRWTLETWFQYPLTAQASGDVFESQVLTEDALGRQIVVKAGRYMGAETDGNFFETGIDLDYVVAQGWHHLAVRVEKDNGLAFYLDGRLQGITPKKYTMSFSGRNTDDSADYIKWGSFENFPTTEFTVALWIKTLGRKESPTTLSYWVTNETFYLSDVNQLIVGLGGESFTTTVSLDDGFWHHLAVTWERRAGGLKIYKDGHLMDSLAGFKQGYTIPENGTLVLGQKQGPTEGSFRTSEAFDGVVYGLSIWNAVRNEEDIRRDMYTTFKGTESSLVGYWPMETFHDDGLKVKDLKATNPQHGEIVGAPTAEIVSVINESSYQLKTIGNSGEGGKPFGRLAEIRLWSQSLSAEEIAAHARANVLSGNEPGLVAYYPMNEAGGSTVHDHSSGAKIHATLSGSDWKACTGEMNKSASDKPKFKALSFSGSNNYVKIPGLSGELGGNELTIEYWFRGTLANSAVRQQSGSYYIVSPWGSGEPGHIMSNDGGTGKMMSAGDVQNNQWHHVAFTWKKGETNGFVSYLDGGVVAKENAISRSVPAIHSPVYLGSYIGIYEFINGKMSEVRIWKTARTEEEIIANMHRRLTGKETGLKACYPLDSFMEVDGVIEVRDITSNGYHGTVHGATLVDVEDLLITGNVDRSEVLYFDSTETRVDCGNIDLTNKSFSLECWVKNGRPGAQNIFVAQGSSATGKGLVIGFRDTNQLTIDFVSDGLSSTDSYSDQDWHHFACTYDHTSRTQTLYRDGAQVGQRIANAHYSGTGELSLSTNTFRPGNAFFKGSLDDIRLWSRALSQDEIQSRKSVRLSGEESGLIAYWPVVNLVHGKLKDHSAEGKYDGTIHGAKVVVASAGLPFSTNVTDLTKASISASEYATMGLDPERPGLKSSMLRSFRAYSTKPGDVDVLCDMRIEALELKWVGNAQFKPTLLGFIEGAPPVPSENLTVDYDYNNATTVTLREAQDVSYTWNRTKDVSHGLDLDLFLGAGWGVSGGVGIETKISEGRAGFKGSLNTRFVDSKSSNITSGSTISFSDALALRGEQERGIKFPHLGKRFLPKNVGYALVVSGVADIFITRLARSRRMISYEMRPVEGVPLDINTITFQINPTYTMNGSLDGLTGTQPTSERFFRHIPDMRAQYGSLYPASYYRIKEAYDLKQQIEQWDKDREAYFWNFDVTWRPGVAPERQFADPSSESSYGQVSIEREEDKGAADGDDEESTAQKQDEKIDKLQGDMEKEKDKAQAKAEDRKDEINKRFQDPEARERASAALAAWQTKMENLLIRAGKRNIVNTYVWDANGGLRAESQDFANTIEHTIGSNFTFGVTLGGMVDVLVAGFKMDLTALYAGELTQTSSKTENIGKTFGLDVDLFGLESKEVTNLDGKPRKPAEKVARYRFMSFYLGGNTDNFHDFFDYVVDPEWLAGNSEGARALRQAQSGKPNKAWRVLHRVTYVERPALEGVSVDTRRVSGEDQVAEVTVNYFDSLEKKSRAIQAELATVLDELREVRDLMDKQAGGS